MGACAWVKTLAFSLKAEILITFLDKIFFNGHQADGKPIEWPGEFSQK